MPWRAEQARRLLGRAILLALLALAAIVSYLTLPAPWRPLGIKLVCAAIVIGGCAHARRIVRGALEGHPVRAAPLDQQRAGDPAPRRRWGSSNSAHPHPPGPARRVLPDAGSRAVRSSSARGGCRRRRQRGSAVSPHRRARRDFRGHGPGGGRAPARRSPPRCARARSRAPGRTPSSRRPSHPRGRHRRRRSRAARSSKGAAPPAAHRRVLPAPDRHAHRAARSRDSSAARTAAEPGRCSRAACPPRPRRASPSRPRTAPRSTSSCPKRSPRSARSAVGC